MMQYTPQREGREFAPLSLARRLDVSLPHARSEPMSRRVTSEQLLGNANEIVIEHAGAEYRLRLTRNDKLILNK